MAEYERDKEASGMNEGTLGMNEGMIKFNS